MMKTTKQILNDISHRELRNPSQVAIKAVNRLKVDTALDDLTKIYADIILQAFSDAPLTTNDRKGAIQRSLAVLIIVWEIVNNEYNNQFKTPPQPGNVDDVQQTPQQ